MADPGTTPVDDLRRSLNSLNQLRRSALTSVFLMALGGVIVLGSMVYSLTQLRPLEEQITSKQRELEELETTATSLLVRRDSIVRESHLGEAQLDSAQLQLGSTLVELRQIAASPLPTSARASVENAIRRIHVIQARISRAAAELPPIQAALPPDVPAPPAGDPALQAVIAELFSDRAPVRLRAYDQLMADFRRDPALVPSLLAFARENSGNLNGIYNTLVVLSHVDRTLLRPHVQEVRDFAKDVEPLGPRIRDRVRTLLQRLPNAG